MPDEVRKPLVPVEDRAALEAERVKLEAIAEKKDDAMRAAALAPPVDPPAPALVSSTVAKVLGTIATLAAAAAPFIPQPFGGAVWIGAFVLAGLAGLSVAAPSWIAGKPVLQGGTVGIFAAAVPVLASISASTTGVVHFVVAGLALTASWLAGVAAPSLTRDTQV